MNIDLPSLVVSLLYTLLVCFETNETVGFLTELEAMVVMLIHDMHVHCLAQWDSSLCQWPPCMITLQIMNT